MTHGVPIVLVDLDGTLADNEARFAHYFPDDDAHDWGYENWLAYDRACTQDPPIPYMVELVKTLDLSYEIQLVTGRQAAAEPETNHWLDLYAIPYSGLSMRTEGDTTPNAPFKVAVAQSFMDEGREIHLAIDDHPGVVAALNEIGIPTLHVTRPHTWAHRTRRHA